MLRYGQDGYHICLRYAHTHTSSSAGDLLLLMYFVFERKVQRTACPTDRLLAVCSESLSHRATAYTQRSVSESLHMH